MGDIDGDGVRDLVVGAKGLFAEGRVLVYSGSDGSFIRSHGGLFDWAFGHTVAGVGDVDGDGVEDYASGITDNGASFDGQVWLWSGANGNLIRRHLAPNFQNQDKLFGEWVDPLGDINGDGYADFGARYWGANSHEVFIGPDGSHHRTDTLSNYANTGVCRLSDVDGDGCDDYARCFDFGDRIALVSGANGSILREFANDLNTHPQEVQTFGWGAALERLGDVYGGPEPEIVVSVMGVNICQAFSGELGYAQVLSTDDGSVVRNLLWTRDQSWGWGCEFRRMSAGEDVNGDGIPDLVAGSSFSVGFSDGATQVYSGRTGTVLWRIPEGDHCTLMGDLDGDGLSEFGWGNPGDDSHCLVCGKVTIGKGFPGDAERVCTSSPNSTGVAARLSLEGAISIGNDSFGVIVDGGVPHASAQAIFGAQTTQVPFGAGWLCVQDSAGVRRLGDPFTLDAAGFGLKYISLASMSHLFQPGTSWTVQVAYDDPAGPFGLNTDGCNGDRVGALSPSSRPA